MLDKTKLMIVLQQDKENGREPVLTIENPGLWVLYRCCESGIFKAF